MVSMRSGTMWCMPSAGQVRKREAAELTKLKAPVETNQLIQGVGPLLPATLPRRTAAIPWASP